MKRLLFFGIAVTLLQSSCTLFAQSIITPSSNSILFNPTFETATDSFQITFSNASSNPVTIEDVVFFNTYSKPAFSVSDTNFSIPGNGTYQIWVRFNPYHNIQHNSEMVLITNSGRGNIAIDLKGQGKFSNTYYSTTENLEADQLKTALRIRIGQGYNSLGYNAARDVMFMSIDNKATNGQGASVNTLECVYTGRLIFGYSSRSAAQNSPNNFNTEHTWPQSLFGSNEPMQSDLFHLYPTDNNANSQRANSPFGIVSNPTWQEGGSKGTNSLFEPRDQHKGKVARTMLYFGTRYSALTSIQFLVSQESILRTWAAQFPPDSIEKRRNNDIFAVQGNRNPYIDYPQFLERVSSVSGTSQLDVTRRLFISDSIIDFKTISGGNTVVYQLVMVNHGRLPVTLNGLNITGSDFGFDTGFGNDTSIAPGESLSLKVTCNTTNSIANSTLTFNTNVSGQNQVSIPLTATTSTSTGKINQKSGFKLFPNPSNGTFNLEIRDAVNENVSIEVLDLNGKVVFKQNRNLGSGNLALLQLNNLTNGVYLVRVNANNGLPLWQEKLIKF